MNERVFKRWLLKSYQPPTPPRIFSFVRFQVPQYLLCKAECHSKLPSSCETLITLPLQDGNKWTKWCLEDYVSFTSIVIVSFVFLLCSIPSLLCLTVSAGRQSRHLSLVAGLGRIRKVEGSGAACHCQNLEFSRENSHATDSWVCFSWYQTYYSVYSLSALVAVVGTASYFSSVKDSLKSSKFKVYLTL
jgi:hypothetical protein